MSGYDFLKSQVLSRWRKVESVCDIVISSGRVFQTRGPATVNARSPTVERDAQPVKAGKSVGDVKTTPEACVFTSLWYFCFVWSWLLECGVVGYFILGSKSVADVSCWKRGLLALPETTDLTTLIFIHS